jgi:hypothetical protein
VSDDYTKARFAWLDEIKQNRVRWLIRCIALDLVTDVFNRKIFEKSGHLTGGGHSHKDIAERVGCSPIAVKKAIAQLVAQGHLRSQWARGRGRVNTYFAIFKNGYDWTRFRESPTRPRGEAPEKTDTGKTENGYGQEPQYPLNPLGGGGGGDARARANGISKEAKSVAAQVAAICGYTDGKRAPSTWRGADWVQEMLDNHGWDPKLIVDMARTETIRLKQAGNPPPRSISYFGPMLARLYEQLRKPLPNIAAPMARAPSAPSRQWHEIEPETEQWQAWKALIAADPTKKVSRDAMEKAEREGKTFLVQSPWPPGYEPRKPAS